ncbi:MAG: hypothetical protein MZV70_60470 [Desulfobacterales bacterium]|nr:hypothetical protein [Desulfobacterales bacterium]
MMLALNWKLALVTFGVLPVGGGRLDRLLAARPGHLPHPARAGGRDQHALRRNHRRHARHPALPPGGRQLRAASPALNHENYLAGHGADPRAGACSCR